MGLFLNQRKEMKMDFGQALMLLKAGKKVAREGWNGKGMFVFMRPEDTLDADTIINHIKSLPKSVKDYYNSNFSHTIEEANKALDPKSIKVKFTAYLCMKAADGTIVNGWLASQTDILSNDWIVLD